jgi:hypothetical protein
MNVLELYHATTPFDVVGTHRELRWRDTEYGATAYEVKTGGNGGITAVRVLRTRDGKPVRCAGHCASVGDLRELIEKLMRDRKLA